MSDEFEFQRQSGEIDQLVAAMNRAQLAMVPAKKDATNPFFHSKYADLPAVWDALHSFRVEGIVATQSPMESPDGYIVLETQLTHTSGQWMRSRLKMRVGKDDPQGYGSAITYARRYALGAMTGLVTEEDDDGNAASPQPTTKNFAQKFPEQAKKIEEKLSASMMTGAELKQAVDQAKKQASDAPASLLPGDGSWVVPFGKNKGQRIMDVADEDVNYLLKHYRGKLSDPANATSRFRDEWDNALIEVSAELTARIEKVPV
jgi:hypothetical protein